MCANISNGIMHSFSHDLVYDFSETSGFIWDSESIIWLT